MSKFWTLVDAVTGAVAVPSCGADSPEQAVEQFGGGLVAVPIGKPVDPHLDGWDGETWTPRADVLRDRARAAINERRNVAEWGGCETPSGRADTTPESQRKINGLVTMAMLAQMSGAPFEAGFTLADNTTIQVDAAQMIALGVAVGLHVSACHAVALDKKAALASGQPVDPDTGWPS